MPRVRRRRPRALPDPDRSARDRGDRGESWRAGPRSWLQIAALVLIVAKVALVAVVFDPAAAQAFALPKSAVSRALLYPTIAVLAAYVAVRPERRPRGPLVWAIGVYGLIAAAATAFAVHLPTALYGALGRYLGLTSILDGIVLAIAVMTFVRSTRDVMWVIAGIVAGATGALAYGLVQLAGIDPVRWTEAQTASTLGNSGAFAGLLVCGASVAATILALRWTSLRWSLRLALVLIGAASVAMVLSIGTRSAALAVPVSGVAVAVVAWRAQGGVLAAVSRRRFVVLAAALTLVVAAFALASARSPAGARLLALAQGGDLSSGERALIYRAALDAFLSRPVLGVGPDSFIVAYPAVRPVEIASFSAGNMQSSTHSWFLQQAVGTGALGLIAVLVVAGAAMRSGIRGARNGQLAPAVAIVGLVTFLAQGAFSITHVGTEWLFWGLVGLAGAAVPATAGVAEGSRRRSGARPVPRWSDRAAAMSAALVGLLLALTTVASVDASRNVLLSDRARVRGDLAAAARWAERAVALDGGRADNWNVLGLGYAQVPERAAGAFRRAHDAAPYDSTYLLNLAQTEASLSEWDTRWKEEALAHARRAAAIDPNNRDTQLRVAQLLWSLGDPDGAVLRVERAIALAPRPEDHYRLAADMYEAAGRRTEAIDRLERLVARSWTYDNVPLDMRRRLARLYHEVGDREKIARILSPPRAAQASLCAPTCLQVRFESAEDLRTDDSPGSALNVGNYWLRGRPLPPGSRAELRGPMVVAVTLPAGTDPLVTNDSVQVANVEDAYGRAITPNPTVLTVQ